MLIVLKQIPDRHVNLLRGGIFLVTGGLLLLGPSAFSLYGAIVCALSLPFFFLWVISMYVRFREPNFDDLDDPPE